MASKKNKANKPKTGEQIIKEICKNNNLPKEYCDSVFAYIDRIKNVIAQSSIDFQEKNLEIFYDSEDNHLGLVFEHPQHGDMIEFYINNEGLYQCLSWDFDDQFGYISTPSDIDIIERLVMVCLSKDIEKDITHTRLIHNQTNRTLN